MSAQTGTHRSIRQILIAAILIGSIVFILFSITCLLWGKCYLEYDSTFSALYLCQADTAAPVIMVSEEENSLFLCGKIEGTTPRPGGLYLFYNDVVVLNTDFEQMPGEFMEPLPLPGNLESGHYRVEIGYAKRLLASTEFEVTEQ